MFMSSDGNLVPPAMARNIFFNHVLHERVIVMTLVTRDVPRVNRMERAVIENFPHGIFRVTCSFGFVETPAIHEVLESMKIQGLDIDIHELTFFLGRDTLIAARRRGGMALWREHLFAFMSQNSYRATQSSKFHQIRWSKSAVNRALIRAACIFAPKVHAGLWPCPGIWHRPGRNRRVVELPAPIDHPSPLFSRLENL